MYREKIYRESGYTLVEMLVSIAIMSIMMGIIGISFSSGKNFDTMKLENQRIASAIRNVRNRDFNGVVAYNMTTSASQYPPEGYGLHMETNYKICDNAPTKSCFVHLDCGSGTNCNTPSGRSSYTIFADFANADGGSYFDGGKTGTEYVEEIKVPKDFALIMPNAETWADIVFKGGVVAVYTSPVTMGGPSFAMQLQYKPGGVLKCQAVRNQKGLVTLDTRVNNATDALVPCP